LEKGKDEIEFETEETVNAEWKQKKPEGKTEGKVVFVDVCWLMMIKK